MIPGDSHRGLKGVLVIWKNYAHLWKHTCFVFVIVLMVYVL